MSFKTEAIVLRERVMRDADRWYDILTPQQGKLGVVAAGAAKSTSKLAGHMMPFNRVSVMIGRGRQDHLAAANTVVNFQALRCRLSDFILASSLVELILKIQVPGPAAQREFDLLFEALSALAEFTREQDKRLVPRIFLWKLLALSGWRPNLDTCTVCHSSFSKGEVAYDARQGFIHRTHDERAVALHEKLSKFIRNIMSERPIGELVPAGSDSEFEDQWFRLSHDYYREIVSAPIESFQLLAHV